MRKGKKAQAHELVMKEEQNCVIGHIPLVDDYQEDTEPTTVEALLRALDLCEDKAGILKRYLDRSLQRAEEPAPPKSVIPRYTTLPQTQSLDDNCGYCCWWCCHTFEGQPIRMPHWVLDGVFHVTGNFCSFPCALAYNQSQKDENVSHRQNLLVLMYRCHGLYDILIPAPPRELLTMFGGCMSIDDFRSSNNKPVRLLPPPIQSIRFTVEVDKPSEVLSASYPKPSAFVPLDVEQVNRAKESLKLKRAVPKKTQYVSMEETLGLIKRTRN